MQKEKSHSWVYRIFPASFLWLSGEAYGKILQNQDEFNLFRKDLIVFNVFYVSNSSICNPILKEKPVMKSVQSLNSLILFGLRAEVNFLTKVLK